MASSRKSPRSSALTAHVTAVLKQHVKSGDRLVAGLSGGVDSVVLLDLLRRLSTRLRFELAALHVNHQLNPAAGRWAAFCRAFCKQQGVALTVARVTVPRGNSLEAAARPPPPPPPPTLFPRPPVPRAPVSATPCCLQTARQNAAQRPAAGLSW